MKRAIFIPLLFLVLGTPCAAQTCTSNCRTCQSSACVKQSAASSKVKPADRKSATNVEVLYFHGKQRCKTCNAIESETRAVVHDELASEVKAGKVRFRVVDITTPEGKVLAAKYKVSWSSLFVVQHKGGKEKVNNLTQFAFANAAGNAEGFRKELKNKVLQLLK